ncbi:MAG: hypothetical protein N5P05_002692 [Chroococcopsis gigantea SAG 12.99]|nr:hypothetical protein [Chroococcopsis gigantea SAG 12.99]
MNTTNSPLVFQIKELPDLNSQKYTSVHGNNVKAKIFSDQTKFLLFFTEISKSCGLTFSIRYLYLPEENFDERLKIYCVLIPPNKEEIEKWNKYVSKLEKERETGKFDAKILNELGKLITEKINDFKELTTFIGEFYDLKIIEIGSEEKAKYDNFFENKSGELSLIGETIKYEESIPEIGSSPPYYAPLPWEPDEANDMCVVCDAINRFKSPLMLDITLRPYPAFPYPASADQKNQLIKALSETIDDLKKLSNPRWSERGGDGEFQEDSTIRIFERIYEKYQSYVAEDLYQYTFRVLGKDELPVIYVLNTFLTSGTVKSRYRNIIITKSKSESEFNERFQEMKEGKISTGYWKDWDEGNIAQHLSNFKKLKPLFRLVSFKEITGLFRIVVPGKAPVKGIRQENSIKPPREDESIDFGGHEINSPENTIRIKLEQLNKHAFICGVPGSGKTTTSFNLLTQLSLKGIPFLVFESAKTEYRSLLQINPQSKKFHQDEIKELESFKEKLRIFTIGNEQISPFRFNPFEISEGVPFYEHISNLEASFRGALPLFGPLPALLSEAMEEIYYDRGWTGQETGTSEDKKDQIPTIKDLYKKITDLLESKNYAGEVKSNIKAALEVRIGSLVRGGIGLILNTTESYPSIDDLLKYPTILELDYLNQDQANLITFFLLTKIREYVKRDSSRILQSGPPAHVILLEEAHNIVGRNLGNTSSEDANTKKEAANYITRMLAEMRALREAIIVIDQLPTAVAFEVIKNTNVKIAHRLVSADDRKDIGSSMLLNNSQMEEVARFNPGQSFLYMEGWYRPIFVNIPRENSAKVKLGVESSCTDDQLTLLIKQKQWYKDVQIILNRNNYDKCCQQLKNITKYIEQFEKDCQILINCLYELRHKFIYTLAPGLKFQCRNSLINLLQSPLKIDMIQPKTLIISINI